MPSFLAPLRTSAYGRFVLRNQRTGAIIAQRLLIALDSRSRRRGLLKHTGLAMGEAMVIAPTNAIHTFFMRFTIDVAFVDRAGRVLKICSAVRPWRIACAWGGYAVLETAANGLDGIRPGDTLAVAISDGPRVNEWERRTV